MYINFHTKNRLKLSATYLSIIMFLSIVFSVAIYKVSSDQIKRGLRPAPARIPPKQISHEKAEDRFNDFEDFRSGRIDESRIRLKEQLLLINFGALFFGTFLSYLLAIKALSPIERALEKQDRFASDASHELRTPLAVMQSEIEVALRSKKLTKDESKEILQSSLNEVKKMTNISNALLTLAHSESQKEEFFDCDLKKLINDAVQNTKLNANQKNIVITSEIQVNFVRGEFEKLKQLFIIILDNAIKYSYKDSKIDIEAKSIGKKTQIDIADTGMGIDAKEQKLVFHRFYRTDKSRTKDGNEGFGLGLSIARNIVLLHNGHISALSNDPKGTIIRIILPTS